MLFKKLFILFLLLGVTSSSFAQLQLTLPTLSGKPGTEQIVGILVNDITSYNAMGYQFKIKYDKNIIYMLNPGSNAGTLTSAANAAAFYTNDVRVDSSMIIVTAASGQDKITGFGLLFKVKVKFLKLGSTTLTLDPTFANKFTDGTADIPFVTVNGNITVSNANTPPVFDAVPAKTVNENVELKFTVNATDVDNDVITYATTSIPTGATFNTTTKEFVWKPTYKQSGTHTASFTASDGKGGQTTLNVIITVVDVNTAPTITPIPDKSINEGQTLNFDVIGVDAEGDDLTYDATGLPTGSVFDKTARKFSWKPSSTQSGDYTVTFTVSDGKLSGSTNVKITVIDANTPPVFTPISDKTVNTNQQLTFDVVATDAEGDPITFFASSLPTGANFDVSLKRFSWKPTVTQVGDHTVTFGAFDGTNTTTMQVKIKVVKGNSTPVFDAKTINDTTISVHNVPMLFKYQFKAADADGDPISFRIDGDSPTGSVLSSTGLFQWITNSTHAGKTYLFMVTVSDGALSETKVVTISVRSTVVGVEEEIGLPTKYSLHQNYPNPFNPTTSIKFSLPKEGNVSLKVYNLMGQEIATLIDGYRSAGFYSINFEGKDLSSGLYLYKLEAEGFSKTMKMMLAK